MFVIEDAVPQYPQAPTMGPSSSTGPEDAMLGKNRWEQIKALKEVGVSVSEIARRLELDRKTVRNSLAKNQWQPYEREPRQDRLLDPWKDWLLQRMPEVNYSAQILLQELSARGFQGSYATVRRFVQPYRLLADKAALCQTRFETAPGEQAQVDYGQFTAPFRQGPRKIHIFVMTLGYSRRACYLANGNERLGTFLESHERTFEHFNGVTRTILYDRPRLIWQPAEEGRPGKWNSKFMSFARHWGYEPWLCAAYRAQTKGKVESGVKYVKRNFLPGRSFVDIVDLEEQLQQWQDTIADTRIHGTVHQRPVDRFPAEQAQLMPIAGHRPFGARIEVARVVADDYLVSYGANRYSVPFALIGKTVEVVQQGDDLIMIHRQREVARHKVLAGKHQMLILPEHGPGAIRQRQQHSTTQARLLNRWFGPPEVEVRDLHHYEEVTL